MDILEEKEMKNILSPYVARVDTSNDCYDEDICLTVEKFNELNLSFVKELEKRNFKISKQYNYPNRINTVCSCDRVNTMVINADGEIYKCWDDIGKKDISLGNINNSNEMKLNKSYMDYLMYDPTYDSKCKECKILPICMGGCSYKRIFNPSSRCSHNTKTLRAYLEKVTENLLKNVAMNNN